MFSVRRFLRRFVWEILKMVVLFYMPILGVFVLGFYSTKKFFDNQVYNLCGHLLNIIGVALRIYHDLYNSEFGITIALICVCPLLYLIAYLISGSEGSAGNISDNLHNSSNTNLKYERLTIQCVVPKDREYVNIHKSRTNLIVPNECQCCVSHNKDADKPTSVNYCYSPGVGDGIQLRQLHPQQQHQRHLQHGEHSFGTEGRRSRLRTRSDVARQGTQRNQNIHNRLGGQCTRNSLVENSVL